VKLEYQLAVIVVDTSVGLAHQVWEIPTHA
jgi:hypothetical protein